ncbi:Y-family DNA polymerase [Oceanispirochaeta sp. M1]|nr:Y-family DNA polymerase [Oceanispirochaeta sp. M1]
MGGSYLCNSQLPAGENRVNRNRKMTALVDCNSFYASCERVFRPDLTGRPVVVLSNNDGCLVAMSREAKEMNIPRGVPLFKVQKQLKQAGAAVFSSNYTLYDDLSRRVMDILEGFTPQLEVYSIDEAFLILQGSREELLNQASRICERVYNWLGIPVSVGIGSTKTLAKIAGKRAKNIPGGVCFPAEEEWPEILEATDVGKIWGIGRQYARKLHSRGIISAADLMAQEESWVKKEMTLVGLKTLWELRGRPSFTLEETPSPKQGIMTSRSFSFPVTEKEDILEAGADYASGAAAKMRAQGSSCRVIHTSVMTNPFRESDRQYARGITEQLSFPMNYPPSIVAVVRRQLEKLYRPGFRYKKISVFLSEIEQTGEEQMDLFYSKDDRSTAVMEAVDHINNRYGRHTLHCMPLRPESCWQMKRQYLSPCYTTKWKDIPVVRSGAPLPTPLKAEQS